MSTNEVHKEAMFKRIENILDEKKITAILVTDPYNMRYISGFRGGEGTLFISRKKHVLITDSRYTEAAQKESDFQVIENNKNHKVTAILQELLSEAKSEVEELNVGYEDDSMVCSYFNRLHEELPLVNHFVPLGHSLCELRQIKTEQELSLLRQAEHIGDIAFGKILDFIRPGVTELEIRAELEYYMQKAGAEGLSFDTIVASGIHSSMPHAIPSEKKIEMGDFITMDFGCRYHGYCSDMTRTIVVGKANDRQKEIYQLVLQANRVTESLLHAGMICKEVDKIARDIIEDAGYGNCFGHGLGHSVGLEIHESPACNMRDETCLQENMIMTVEPGVYIPGFGGVRIEDMVIVKRDGIENLASSNKELIEL